MGRSAVKLRDTGVGKLLLLLVAACVLSMAGVAVFYHMALERVVNATADSSAEAVDDFRSSYTLIESLSRTQNALQRLLRENDPDVLEKLVADLDAHKQELSREITALGEDGKPVRARFNVWTDGCNHIVQTFLRGENAQANSELVNGLMPESEKVLLEIRKVNQANVRDAQLRATALHAEISRIRRTAVTGVALAAILVAAGGLALRRQVSKETGAIADALGRLTSLRADGPPLYIVSLRDLTERKKAEAQSAQLQDRLLTASGHAGMTEVATGVLHNVGNVLNSVNVSATVVADKLRHSEVATLVKVGALINHHKQDLAAFLTTDEQGKLVPEFIGELAQLLSEEQRTMLSEMDTLTQGVEHIKQIVSAQQTLVKKSAVLTAALPSKLVETALTMQSASLRGDGIEIVRQFAAIESIPLDQHRIVQILVNLIANAKHAVTAGPALPKRIILAISHLETESGPRLCFHVTDTGMGIPPQNLTRIFSHGFTTKKEGHGFGLHSSANAAREMGGTLTVTSPGPGKGATFTLEIPLAPNHQHEPSHS